MKQELVDILRCPECKGILSWAAINGRIEAIEKALYCPKCNIIYPIENDIPNMLPPELWAPVHVSGNICDARADRDNKQKWIAWQEYDFTHGGKTTTGQSVNERSRVVSLAMIGKEGLVLDAGCCDGHFSKTIMDKGNNVVSLDLPAVIKQTYPLNPGMCISADACKMPFESHVFNAIYASELIEHLFEPDIFIDECWRILKMGAKLIVCTPWDKEASLCHETHRAWFDKPSMSKLLMDKGFLILSIEDIPESRVMVFQAVAHMR